MANVLKGAANGVPTEPHERGRPWHMRAADEVAALLQVNPSAGLDVREATRRLAQHGPNAIAAARGRGPARMLLAQFSDFMVLVLLASAVLAGFLGEPQDILAIGAIVLLNAALGFAQEYRAERAMTALQAMSAPQARVRRNRQLSAVAAADLVPGDVVLLEAGNVVPADVRLIEAARLQVEEATLTGESLPVEKTTAALEDPCELRSRSRGRRGDGNGDRAGPHRRSPARRRGAQDSVAAPPGPTGTSPGSPG